MQKRYDAIDGLRTIACLGIVLMHIKANNSYEISGFLYDNIIPSFTDFTFLFMVISAFGMCCGYYEKIIHNQMSISDFYGKRFKRIWPFFAVLIVLDVIISPSLSAIYEAFADLTLLFGFLPSPGKIEVIGVGWFIGLVFVFYLIFPFFCCLIENRRRAWISFGISLIWNIVCSSYFDVGRSNILYSGCFFLAGGLMYLYREKIEKIFKSIKCGQWILLLTVAVSVTLYYLIGSVAALCLLVSATLLLYAMLKSGGGIGQQNHTLYWIHQHGNIPQPYGYIPCD